LFVTLLALAVMIGFSRLPRISAEHAPGEDSSFRELWQHKRLVLGVIGIFLYVGAEVAIGSFLVNYFTQPDIGNLPEKAAAGYVSLYWGGAMVGRFIGSALLQKIRTGRLLAFNAVIACSLVVISMSTFGHIAMWSILAVGLFNSVMFPSIFTIAIDGLGPLTSKASGALVTAIVGGAVIPLAQGALADRIGVHHAFILPALCYVFVFFYALQGLRAQPAFVTPAVPD
jgi:MFS transporter, FHS family, L-fucose permease